jgi:glycerol-3-phosphate dehydrogenase
MVPGLRGERLRSCALYADAWTNDGRLTIANLRAAEQRGAVVLNYAEAVAPREVSSDGRTFPVRAKTVINAAGPWVDRVRLLEDAGARPSMRLSKGVHVVVERPDDWNAALTISHDKVRVSFAVPWEGSLLLGTTDTLYDGEPETLRSPTRTCAKCSTKRRSR